MPQANTNEVFGPTENPVGGWVKVAWVGGVPMHLSSGGFTSTNSPRYTNYMMSPPLGWKQKTGHARGVQETSWTVSGELTVESRGLINFLDPSMRGQLFTVRIQQGSIAEILPYSIMENCSFQAGPNSIVTVTISGRSVFPIYTQPAVLQKLLHHPVPGWATGRLASYIRNWTISHQVPISANWANDQNPRPVYYRPGESEYQLQLGTSAVFRQYDGVSLGLGDIAIINGLVTERSLSYSGKDPKAYRVNVTNVDLNRDAYTRAVFLTPKNYAGLQAWPVTS